MPIGPFLNRSNAFLYWKTSRAILSPGTIYNEGQTYNLNLSMTLYAVFSSFVNRLAYEYQNGTDPLIRPADYGSTITVATAPSRSGYSFVRWNTAADGSGTTSYSPGQSFIMPDSFSLYAIWSLNVTIFSLTFNSQGGTVVWPVTNAPAGSSVRLADAPVRSGYTFLGWFSNPTGGTRIGNPGDNFIINTYVTLYAQWNALAIEIEGNSPIAQTCPPLRTGSILFPRNRYLPRCCPPLTYIMTSPTVDNIGIVRFVSSYPMNGTDMYRISVTNNQPANLLIAYTKYYKNSSNGYDSGVLAYPGVPFNITVVPFQDNIPRVSYTVPFTTIVPSTPLLLTATQNGASSVFLQWLVPESDQYVSTITSYTVRYNLVNFMTVTSNSAVITGLSGSVSFQVRATNMAGAGQYSTTVTITIS